MNDLKHGYGRIDLPGTRQTRYKGKWENDKMHGFGTLSSFGINFYCGLMQNNAPGKKGRMFCKDLSNTRNFSLEGDFTGKNLTCQGFLRDVETVNSEAWIGIFSFRLFIPLVGDLKGYLATENNDRVK